MREREGNILFNAGAKIGLLLGVLVASFLYGENQGSLFVPDALADINIEDKAGAQVPLGTPLVNQDGQKVLLGDYFNKDRRPVIVTLGYYGCPMLCTLVLNGLVEGLSEVSFKPGRDYRVVSISIDHREKPDLAKKKQEAYLSALGKGIDGNDWTFHVTDEDSARKLADSLGFNYRFDKKADQFAHGAGFFVLSPQGVLARTVFGIKYPARDIMLALSDAVDGKIGSFVDRVILSCFHYDPDSHKYGVYILGVMRIGGVLTILILGTLLLFYFRGEKKRLTPLGS